MHYLRSTGIADTCFIGPEAGIFVDDVRFDQNAHEAYYHVDSVEGEWNRGRKWKDRILATKFVRRKDTSRVPPTDHLMDLRNEMMQTMIDCGLDVEAQHHEVASGGQCEIDLGIKSSFGWVIGCAFTSTSSRTSRKLQQDCHLYAKATLRRQW